MRANIATLPNPPPPPPPQLQGDPATRRFGIILLSTLAVLLIGVGIGIGIGNWSHYRYFGPYDQTNLINILSNYSYDSTVSAKSYQAQYASNELENND